MGTRATLTVSLILVGWSGLVWLHRAQVAAPRPAVHAGIWMAVGLLLLAKGLTELWGDRDAGDQAEKRPALAWFIGSLPVFTWLAARWRSLPFVFTESSYAATLFAAGMVALIALLAALAASRRPPAGSALPFVAPAAGVLALVLVAASTWTHLRIDHGETGTYGEMSATLFVVEHPVFWALAIVAAFALWWPHHGRT